MPEKDLNKLKMQADEVARRLRRYMDPFVKQDKGDIANLEFIQREIQNDISRSASEFLKSAGFKTDGSKKKKGRK